MIDVDSKDLSNGMSCPPSCFVTEDFLCFIKEILSLNNGMVVLNLACRAKNLSQSILDTFNKVKIYEKNF